MSTYLVAFVVGLFDYIEETTSDGIKVRGCCPVSKSEKGKLALSISVKSIELFTKYFSMPYILPKLDMVDVPEFSGGAMENYGSITYCKDELLHDDLNSATSNTHRAGHPGYGTQPSRYDSYRPPLTQNPLGAAAAQTGYAQPAYGAPPAYSTAGYA
ncbi:aminopeptidase M1-like protein isoform X1 [Tanacetum coccineum]